MSRIKKSGWLLECGGRGRGKERKGIPSRSNINSINMAFPPLPLARRKKKRAEWKLNPRRWLNLYELFDREKTARIKKKQVFLPPMVYSNWYYTWTRDRVWTRTVSNHGACLKLLWRRKRFPPLQYWHSNDRSSSPYSSFASCPPTLFSLQKLKQYRSVLFSRDVHSCTVHCQREEQQGEIRREKSKIKFLCHGITENFIVVKKANSFSFHAWHLPQYASGCLVYIKELDQWEEGPSMNFLRDMGSTSVRLSDGRYFVIGTNIDAEYYIRSFC